MVGGARFLWSPPADYDADRSNGSYMAKHIPPPPDIEIAALRKQTVEVRNPMEPGAGTPWEDRGTLGLLSAFVKTCVASLTAPSSLFSQIRRPETRSEEHT